MIWDKNWKDVDIIKDDPDTKEQLFYYCINVPIPLVNDRDNVALKKVRFDFPQVGQRCIHMKSVSHEKHPPRKGRVRFHLKIFSAVLMHIEDGKGAKITFFSQTNPGGKIPSKIVNKFVGKVHIKFIKTYIDACKLLADGKLLK